MPTLAQLSETQSQKASTVNENFATVALVALFARRAAAVSGLTWGYYGGVLYVDGVATTIADGTVALTNSATNYIEATRAGVVSANTTGFTAGRIPLYTAVTSGGAISSYTDLRADQALFTTGRLSKSVAGSSNVTLTAAEARNDILEFTGLLTGNINIIVPDAAKRYMVYNNTTGAFTITIKTNAGSGVAPAQGGRMLLHSDGTNVVQAETTFPAPIGVGVAASSSANLTVAAGTTSVASMRIPHGAAPSSPEDGDIWTTTAGLYVRINGATVGPLS